MSRDGLGSTRGKRAVLALALMIVVTACGGEEAAENAEPAGLFYTSEVTKAEFDADQPATVSVESLAIDIPSGSIPTGALEVRMGGVPDSEIVGDVYEITAADQPERPVTLRLPVGDDGNGHIARWEPDLEMWLPLETTVANGWAEAETEHFSFFSWLLDTSREGASWLEYQVGRVTGNRVAMPSCGGALPSWVDNVNVVDDRNAEIRVCGESRENQLVLKVGNNRAYPQSIEFSLEPAAVEYPDMPLTLSEVVMSADRLYGDTHRVFLRGKETVHVVFDQPDGYSGNAEAYARRDVGTSLSFVVWELADIAGADLPIGNGKTLGRASLECLAETTALPGDLSRAETALDAIPHLQGCVTQVVNTELANAVPDSDVFNRLTKLKKFLFHFNVAKYSLTAADMLVNDGTTEAEGVDISFFWKGAEHPSQTTTTTTTTSTTTTQAPATTSAATSFSIGDAFADHCVVAWPTAPVVSSQGVTMRMDCLNLPADILFADVFYPDPEFRADIHATSYVPVYGEVYDIAESGYGFKVVVVVAESIG